MFVSVTGWISGSRLLHSTPCQGHDFLFLLCLAVPAFMPAPTVVGISSTELNVTWSLPTASQARGNITVYRLYQNMARNLSADPFASPAYWQVRISTACMGADTVHTVLESPLVFKALFYALEISQNWAWYLKVLKC